MANKPLPIITDTVEARFWSKVDKSPGQGPNGDCWCWTGHLGEFDNYPNSMAIKIGDKHFYYRVSHVALTISGKPKPEGELWALHSCDHPPCVRPDHLRWGTHMDNVADANARRKHSRGFTPDEVRAIRASNDRQVDIARHYGVSSACILNIRKRVSHKHVE